MKCFIQVYDTLMCHKQNVIISPRHVVLTAINLSMVCRLMGHRFQHTLVIHEDGDFYEVEDAQYCRQCGTVHESRLAS